MPALITQRADGTYEAAFAREPAWWGFGNRVFDEAPTSYDMLVAAQMDWDVEQRVPQIDVGGEMVALDDYRVNLRSDNHKVFGVVSKDYVVCQNWEGFEFLDKLTSDGKMRYESAFTLKGGKEVCILAQMPGYDEYTDGDPGLRYVLWTMRHDGSGAIRLFPTAVRVVCANTLRLALDTAGDMLVIPHVGNVEDKLKDAQLLLSLANDKFAVHVEQAQRLAEAKIDAGEFVEYLGEVFPIDEDASERTKKKVADLHTEMTVSFHGGGKYELPQTKDTWWRAVNSITGHVDHSERRVSQRNSAAETRWNVTQKSSGQRIKRRAFDLALEGAGIVDN